MRFVSNGHDETRTIELTNLVIAGWTGRDIKAVQHHIDELVELGVRAPKTIPTYYRASVELLTTRGSVQALGERSSGEVEPVLLSLDGELWVGIGSDHTDREVEAYSVEVSKQMCLKPVARDLWRFADVEAHWDKLVLRSRIRDGGDEWTLYQEGTLSQIRPPLELIKNYPGAQGDKLPNGTAMFCGTFSAKGGIRSASEFSFEIEDPLLGRKITHAYAIDTLQRSEKPNAD
ncbi:MAG: DUF2848 domain-containing protein [Xanthobacteraceae bacterium]